MLQIDETNANSSNVEDKVDGEEIIAEERRQSRGAQVNNPGQDDEETVMPSILLKKVMEMMTRGFDNLQSRIQSENSKLVEDVNSKIESEN
jgi:hypothetical protein